MTTLKVCVSDIFVEILFMIVKIIQQFKIYC